MLGLVSLLEGAGQRVIFRSLRLKFKSKEWVLSDPTFAAAQYPEDLVLPDTKM